MPLQTPCLRTQHRALAKPIALWEHWLAPSPTTCATPVPAGTLQDVNSDYNIGRVLGRGQFGTTREAEDKAKQGSKYACKSIAKRKLS